MEFYHLELELSGCNRKSMSYSVLLFVGSCLATKVFIGNLLAMGRGWVIIK